MKASPDLQRRNSERACAERRQPSRIEAAPWRSFFCNFKGCNVGSPEKQGRHGFVSTVNLPRLRFLETAHV